MRTVTCGLRRALIGAVIALPAILTTSGTHAQAVLENVIVETYYISDAQDATDTIGTPGGLMAGARTFRVYLDLCDSCTLRAVYGDTNHVLSIASTDLLFNHNDRGRVFGHELNNSALDEGTTALDSWLSLRAASNQKLGILKADDTDGSIVGGTNNDGGSAQVSGGLLVNADPDAGAPLTTADGLTALTSGTITPPNFNVAGDDPSAAFFDSTLVNAFVSNDFRMGCSTPGVQGPTADNRVLVAQMTTAGELSFKLNIEVERNGTLLKLVSTDSVLLPDETANGLLVYPPQCGCMDPNFLEYDPNAGCDDGSCQTIIVFGCLDTNACNYDALANFNVQQLCCYGPDSCNGLDVSIVCPDVGIDDDAMGTVITAYPNPADEALHLSGHGLSSGAHSLRVLDATGRPVVAPVSTLSAGVLRVDLTALRPGAYLVVLQDAERIRTIPFIRAVQ